MGFTVIGLNVEPVSSANRYHGARSRQDSDGDLDINLCVETTVEL